jgi:flagellum-specific peptidoglycan hydrolase FlgJ
MNYLNATPADYSLYGNPLAYDFSPRSREPSAAQPHHAAGTKRYTLKDKLDFLGKVYKAAKPASEETGLSLPFILAHSVHETDWGRRIRDNNLFNLKADWFPQGPPGKNSVYRVYPSFDDSVKDYMDYIGSTPGYMKMFEPTIRTDPAKLAHVIQQAGYGGDDSSYARKLIFLAGHPDIRRAILASK